MPSPIFEFRRAVHDSPLVIYHPTENLRIRSACLFQATENKSVPVLKPTPCKLGYLMLKKKKKRREAQLLLRLNNRTHRTNYAPKFLPRVSWSGRYSNLKEWKGVLTGSSVCNLTRKRIAIMWNLTEKQKWTPKKIPKASRSPFYSIKKKNRENLLLAQIAKCNLTSIHSRFQDTLRRQVSPENCDQLWLNR